MRGSQTDTEPEMQREVAHLHITFRVGPLILPCGHRVRRRRISHARPNDGLADSCRNRRALQLRYSQIRERCVPSALVHEYLRDQDVEDRPTVHLEVAWVAHRTDPCLHQAGPLHTAGVTSERTLSIAVDII